MNGAYAVETQPIPELSIVALRRSLQMLPAGATGTVGFVHGGGRAYEVEVVDVRGQTQAVVTVDHEDLQVVERYAG